jgi:hypothetical protein
MPSIDDRVSDLFEWVKSREAHRWSQEQILGDIQKEANRKNPRLMIIRPIERNYGDNPRIKITFVVATQWLEHNGESWQMVSSERQKKDRPSVK